MDTPTVLHVPPDAECAKELLAVEPKNPEFVKLAHEVRQAKAGKRTVFGAGGGEDATKAKVNIFADPEAGSWVSL